MIIIESKRKKPATILKNYSETGLTEVDVVKVKLLFNK